MKQHVTGKVLITFKPHSAIDLITNSSTELFVFQGQTKKMVEDLIKSVYPNYTDEYEELEDLKNASNDMIERYLFSIIYSDHTITPETVNLPFGFKFEEIFTPFDYFGNLLNHRQHPLSGIDVVYKQKRVLITDDNRNEILERLLHDGDIYLMFSLEGNPDYEKQEQLEEIGGYRIHLG